jgi:hypothetical protein
VAKESPADSFPLVACTVKPSVAHLFLLSLSIILAFLHIQLVVCTGCTFSHNLSECKIFDSVNDISQVHLVLNRLYNRPKAMVNRSTIGLWLCPKCLGYFHNQGWVMINEQVVNVSRLDPLLANHNVLHV